MRTALFFGLSVWALSSAQVYPDEPGLGVSTIKASPPEAEEDPKTLEQAMARLEATLGTYDEDDQQEWLVLTEFEHKQRPDPSQPEIVLAFKGKKTVGLPFREPESLSFDEVWQWDRQVFDLSPDGEKTLKRVQRSHNVTRFSLSLQSGVWITTGTMLSNGVHDSMGKPTFMGIVRWHADGFEFIGHNGAGRYYAAGGKFMLGTSYGSVRYRETDGRLTITTRVQPYHLAIDADGNTLIAPDFNRPFGQPFAVEYESEPRVDSNTR